MSHRGWSLNALQHPSCLHLCVTMCHVGKAGEFLTDLLTSMLEAGATAGAVSCSTHMCVVLLHELVLGSVSWEGPPLGAEKSGICSD